MDNLSYDAAGNILSLRRRNQNGNIVDNLSYSYQGSTNRLQLVMDAAGKTHGWQAGTTYYNYDASGNLTVAEEFDYQGTIWEYTRDTRNQVIRAAGWGSEAITDYRYNFAGHRYYKHVSGGSWEYFGLDDGVRTGLFGQATPGPIWNILTPSGRVIGRNPYNGAPSYYVTDHLGSTRVVVSSNGSIQEAYDYYPFGLPMPGRSITGWSEIPERFTGYYKDQESYLYYAQARMYDPAIGRFLSVDPLASEMPGWNPYHYTFNNPVRFIDPDGLMPKDPPLSNTQYRGWYRRGTVWAPSGSQFGLEVRSGGRIHQGGDYYASVGTETVAIKDGTVVEVKDYGGESFGQTVLIEFEHTNADGVTETLFAFYAHLSEVSVGEGDSVIEGTTVVGRTGKTGNASGLSDKEAHLHLEIWTQRAFPGVGKEGHSRRRNPSDFFKVNESRKEDQTGN